MTAVPDPRDDLITGSSIHIHGAGESCSSRCITPAVPLGDRVYTAWTGQPYWGGCDQRESVERVLDVIAAEVEACVQAAAKQGAAEERGRWITALGLLAARHSLRWFALELRDRAAALASPAPAPRAEEGQW